MGTILDTDQEVLILSMWEQDASYADISVAAYCTIKAVKECIKRGHPRTREEREAYEGYIPTQEEIAASAELEKQKSMGKIIGSKYNRNRPKSKIPMSSFVSDVSSPLVNNH